MEKLEKYHFIGIGGVGMSALAQILLDRRALVYGSDLHLSGHTERLTQQGAVIKKGHSAKHISPRDTVIYGSAILKSNPELQAAQALKCSLLHRSELLAHLMHDKKSLIVTGTHGKTTTTALLTTVLAEAGHDPSYAIGGYLNERNGKWGRGELFVAEGDESDGTFLNYSPYGAIVTNLETEHLDYFKSFERLADAFSDFFKRVNNPDFLFYCGDDPHLVKASQGRGISYGFGHDCALRLSSYSQNTWSIGFTIHFEGRVYRDISLPLIGEHQALNAAAVFGLALKLGLPVEHILNAFRTFPGIGRRSQKRKEVGGVLFVDDYGHHPTEIAKTLKAIKMAVRERRVVVLFQPHRYTRTQENLALWGRTFEWADRVFVTDIYPAQEMPIEGITAKLIVDLIKKESTVPCSYLPQSEWHSLENVLKPHDVFITFGAGDVTSFHRMDWSPKKWRVGLIFGGQSSEHEISLRSARFVNDSLNRDLYTVTYFGIDKKGQWIAGEEAETQLKNETVIASPHCSSLLEGPIVSALDQCDLFLPILHGPNGEDGTIQGFFEMLGKPYLGPDHRSAAISMDKVLTKRLVAAAGVPTPRDLFFTAVEWRLNRQEIIQTIVSTLPFPVFVKPVRLGSSIGVSKIAVAEHLEAAIENAFRVDTQVMVEEGKVQCREIEFAVLGNSLGFQIDVPGPGEKLAGGELVNYDMKYGAHSVQTTITPHLDEATLYKGKEYAFKAYKACSCNGMTRVDFLLDPQGNWWFFEMNGIPGMTKLSLFPKIWNREGLPPEQLLDRLIILALHKQREQGRHCIA